MILPESNKLPITLLAACFNKTTATYKYYWFLAILISLEKGNVKIAKRELFTRMISTAWYTVNYFNISFGKQDQIQNAIITISNNENIAISDSPDFVFDKIFNSMNSETTKILKHFDRNVPHWFLSPWFPKIGNEKESTRRKRIYHDSKVFFSCCPYSLHQEFIIINDKWIDYLILNAKFLKSFCYWNLALFLQSKNPNVPDITGKLVKPSTRNSLNRQKKQFWDIAFQELKIIKCIYTGRCLTINDYVVEHFVPYSFVSHDLIWNLIPADASFNSSKSNKLPQLDKYFKPFFQTQKIALEIVARKKPRSKILEEYLTIYPDYRLDFSEKRFNEIISPLISIASNNGFEYM